jgi:hypothetical protein
MSGWYDYASSSHLLFEARESIRPTYLLLGFVGIVLGLLLAVFSTNALFHWHTTLTWITCVPPDQQPSTLPQSGLFIASCAIAVAGVLVCVTGVSCTSSGNSRLVAPIHFPLLACVGASAGTLIFASIISFNALWTASLGLAIGQDGCLTDSVPLTGTLPHARDSSIASGQLVLLLTVFLLTTWSIAVCIGSGVLYERIGQADRVLGEEKRLPMR